MKISIVSTTVGKNLSNCAAFAAAEATCNREASRSHGCHKSACHSARQHPTLNTRRNESRVDSQDKREKGARKPVTLLIEIWERVPKVQVSPTHRPSCRQSIIAVKTYSTTVVCAIPRSWAKHLGRNFSFHLTVISFPFLSLIILTVSLRHLCYRKFQAWLAEFQEWGPSWAGSSFWAVAIPLGQTKIFWTVEHWYVSE